MAARYTTDYADYIANHERTPGIGPLAGLARRRWQQAQGSGRGEPEPARSAMSRTTASGVSPLPPEAALLQARQPRLSRQTQATGPGRQRQRRSCCSSTASRCKASGWPRKGTARCSRPTRIASASRQYFDPLPIWYHAVEQSADRTGRLSAARDHAAADGDVPFMALAECLAAADLWPQPALHEPPHRALHWASRRMTGSG